MFGMMPLAAIHAVKEVIDENDRFNKLCNSLPKDAANKLREDRRKKHEDDAAHRKALEIADAGRARNFWGN